MRLRSQLALGFLVLAVLPLAGIVLFTYVSSLGTVKRALEAEAASLARDMDGRMGLVRRDLETRLARVAAPSAAVAGDDEQGFVVRVLREIAPVAPLVDSVEFLPVAGKAPGELAGVERLAGFEDFAAFEGFGDAPFPPPIRIDVQDIVRQAAAGHPLDRGAERELAAGAAEAAHASAEIAEAATLAMLFSGQVDEADLDRRIAAFVARAEEQAKVHLVAQAETAERLRRAEEARQRVAAKQAASAAAVPPTLPAPPAAAGDAPRAPRRESHPAAAAPPPQASPSSSPSAPPTATGEHAGASAVGPRALGDVVSEIAVPVREDGEVVGHVKVSLSRAVLHRLLTQVATEDGDVPFAVDAARQVHLVDEAERERLAGLPLGELAAVAGGGRRVIGDWVVATAHDADTGLTFGVARPVGGALAEVRRSAARNFGFGLGFVALAGLAIPMLSRRMTRQVGVLTEGAQRIARGDLTTRLPVASGNEIGQLATAFNQMAHDLSAHQARLLAEERRRREREIADSLLRADHARKSAELEEARAFQLSLLPRTLPAADGFDLAVFTRTAAEVGGDFYDFHLAGDGTLTVAVGDATGHGARAGTMVAVTKSLFSTYDPAAGPAEFLGRAAQAVRRMELGRMGMALLLARLDPPGAGPRRLSVATAGMPPVLVRRGAGGGEESAVAEGHVAEVYAPGMPLGGLDTA
ncbi:MAG TPA: HAMP domain-containing protein, partial [Thermoanaerobaculia bacterium]